MNCVPGRPSAETQRERDWDLAGPLNCCRVSRRVLDTYGVGPGVIGAMFAPVLTSTMDRMGRCRRGARSAQRRAPGTDSRGPDAG